MAVGYPGDERGTICVIGVMCDHHHQTIYEVLLEERKQNGDVV